MSTHYLIREKDGHEHLVISLDGHPDAEILEKGVTPPRVGACKRKDGRWRLNKAKASKIALERISPQELAKRLMKTQARLDKAEKELIKLSKSK